MPNMKPDTATRIARHLADEMSPAEKAAFVAEMEGDARLRDEVSAARLIWDAARMEDALPEPWPMDVDRVWSRIRQDQQEVPSVARRRSLRRFAWPAAAAVLLLVITTFTGPVFRYSKSFAGTIDHTRFELTDGTVVELRPGSEVIERHWIWQPDRRLELKGEGYFHVKPDANRPMWITCGRSVTEVVGTAFTLKEEAGKVSILVESGKVIFRTLDGDQQEMIALQAGESAISAQNALTRIPNPSPNFTAWRTRELRFTGMPLAEAVADIAAYFGRPVRLESEALGHCRITIPIPFREPELRSVLNAVALAVQAELAESGDGFILRGGNCR